MSRTVMLEIGVNGAFLTRRWEEPDSWMRLTRELGFTCHEFCADVIDPFFSGEGQIRNFNSHLGRRLGIEVQHLGANRISGERDHECQDEGGLYRFHDASVAGRAVVFRVR